MNIKMPKLVICLALFCLVVLNVVIISVANAGSADNEPPVQTETLNTTTTTSTESTTEPTTTTTTEHREEVVLEHPYYIEVDKKAQTVTVFTTNEEGKYEKLVRQMICSTGENHKKFPNGVYKLKDRKFEWRAMLSHGEPMYAQYACTISGDFLFHSVPYKTQGDKSSLYEWRYNELGTNCTGGCIRLTVESAKWIYDNCPPGTPVRIMMGEKYDKELIESLRPAAPVNGWDPTDPDPKNPNYQPQFTAEDPKPDKYAPLYDYDWDWAPEVPKVTLHTTTTTTAATESTTEAQEQTTTAAQAPETTTAAPTAAQTTAATTAAPTTAAADPTAATP